MSFTTVQRHVELHIVKPASEEPNGEELHGWGWYPSRGDKFDFNGIAAHFERAKKFILSSRDVADNARGSKVRATVRATNGKLYHSIFAMREDATDDHVADALDLVVTALMTELTRDGAL